MRTASVSEPDLGRPVRSRVVRPGSVSLTLAVRTVAAYLPRVWTAWCEATHLSHCRVSHIAPPYARMALLGPRSVALSEPARGRDRGLAVLPPVPAQPRPRGQNRPPRQ